MPARRAASDSAGGEYTEEDVAETCAHITELLSEYANLTRQYAPDGRWEPSSPDGATTRTEAAELLATMSRLLARTRHDLRKVDARARQRAHELEHVPLWEQ
ncbi:hypothetical protein OHT76_40850 [Streptomyces sp. NBC_00287]|uniref:hypothetical protein n=1 Tax=Streptomyces sp. NBC_00287 TaxID=2975702 RepID=UPI002E2E59D8|nr:hypothetical protein [Streptomyces sp. NBC_00287]